MEVQGITDFFHRRHEKFLLDGTGDKKFLKKIM